MRKASYVIALFAVLFTLTLNVLSARSTDWLTVKSEVYSSKFIIKYGLFTRCERSHIVIPSPGDDSRFEWTDYKCRSFPTRVSDGCDKDNQEFCIVWTTAGYLTELSAGLAVVASLSIIFGVSTHSRRRRIWRAVAGFVGLHTALQIATFGLVTDAYNRDSYPAFQQARPGVGYILNLVSWVIGILITFGVAITGLAASRGHRWAAGNRAYQAIQG
ncbi:hypothetical protein BXZ70DRAFT_957954 [Cristinia sonorae]|uniref:Uncharacterized protein n=1 Tax=Cristinia sonorae TaxID=1940300 RepID=A0A8K0UF01_9AGAR|nr:hypothetical protein BXZ70DRAFT_957954 [Cristinia sonorae]